MKVSLLAAVCVLCVSVAVWAQEDADYQNWMKSNGATVASLRKNLKDVATKLHQGCIQGRVKLDLDLQAHFSGQPLKPQSCDLQDAGPKP